MQKYMLSFFSKMLHPHVAYSAWDSLSKTAFSICVCPEAETEIKTCHLGQLNLHELTIKAKNAFTGICFYVVFRRMVVHSLFFFFLLNSQNYYQDMQNLNLEIKTLRLCWLICCARNKTQEFSY